MEEAALEKIRIKNGVLVDATGTAREDLLLENGIIAGRGGVDGSLSDGCLEIDAAGKLVMPGGIDPHVHLSLPTPAGKSCDDFRTGSLAALAGGTTYFMDFVTPRRGQPLREALCLRRKEARDSLTGCGLHMGISEWGQGIASEIPPLVEKEGIRSFKAYLAYRESIGISYDAMHELMRIAGAAGGMVMVHCEDGEMISGMQQKLLGEGKTRPCFHAISRPPEAEIRAIEKVIGLSAETECPVYIVHISTGRGADLLQQAKRDGIKVYGETCPHYLLLNESAYDPLQDDLKVLPFILSPPVRSLADQEILWQRLADGTFDVVATDHCPFALHGQKDQGLHDFTKIPNGAGSIRHRLGLMYTYGVLAGKITVSQFVRLVSTRPAEIFGLGDRKGRLLPGYDADIVIWDPDYKGTIGIDPYLGGCDSNIYKGLPVRGRAEAVILKGKLFPDHH